MKKTVFVLIMTLMVLSVSTISVSAVETSGLTTDEAEVLLAQMDALYWKLQGIPEHIDHDDLFYVGNVMAWKPGYSFTDLVAEAESIYTNDIAYDMLALTRTLYYVDGEVVMTSVVPQWHSYNVNGDGLEMNDGMNKDDFTISAKVEINSENVATIEFNYVHIEHPYENGAVIKRSNVTAVFENGKWQINGGDYIDMLSEYHSYWPIVYPEGTPQTSLTTAVYAAVAALALGVVVVKKKH